MGGGDSNINGDGGSSSSSGEEDGDATWKAAINSVATVGFGLSASNGRPKSDPAAVDSFEDDDNGGDDAAAQLHQQGRSKAPKLKLYQIKAQKILDDLLDRSLVMVRNPIPSIDECPQSDEAAIRLFSSSPAGIILDPVGEHPLPCTKPRIVPGEEINEKSKKFKSQIRSVVLNGNDITATAAEACKRALARSEAKEAAAKAAAKREEERVSELKKARGEKWLPSVAKYMQG
ncbi:hypothetical protein OPV22_017912 [Ensete ventricosum]|uniref:INO80 complex subunit B-like conserved region domain-containing protein n=1 Tax=Ensete ventricosum TaxID=4639 RepID=A0AAV8R227_ENSVE|nr:hypothetical protein OPV22_017912 [Ensete ventricosum]